MPDYSWALNINNNILELSHISSIQCAMETTTKSLAGYQI